MCMSPTRLTEVYLRQQGGDMQPQLVCWVEAMGNGIVLDGLVPVVHAPVYLAQVHVGLQPVAFARYCGLERSLGISQLPLAHLKHTQIIGTCVPVSLVGQFKAAAQRPQKR